MDSITNISEANQRIGALSAELKIEKEARTAAVTDLENAKASHQAELDSEKTKHGEELTRIQGEHATTVTQLNDQIEAKDSEITDLKAKIEKLEGNAQTAGEGAVNILNQVGGDALEPEPAGGSSSAKKTPEEIQALYEEQKKIQGSAAKHAFWQKNIKPFES